MRIAEVQLDTEYVLEAWRTNVTRAKAVQIVTRNEGTDRHPRNIRYVQMVATRVTQPYGRSSNAFKIGDTLVLPARDIKKPAEQADKEEADRNARDQTKHEAQDALEAVGLKARGYNAFQVHVILTFEEAQALAARLERTV